MISFLYVSIGVILILLLVYVRWKTRLQTTKVQCNTPDAGRCTPESLQAMPQLGTSPVTPYGPTRPDQPVVVHRMCPHNKVIQGFEVEQKDSLDDHLHLLTRKLAEKEGRLKISKSKIRETQCEIDNLHALDNDVRTKYKSIMEALREDLADNEMECMKLQEQIEWVSIKRAEIGEETSQANTEPRDSLDNLLYEIKNKLADKVNHLTDSHLKIEETKMKMETLHDIDRDVRYNYNQLIKSMRNDLSNNEHECLRLQQQLYWLCKKRVEIGEEVHHKQTLFEIAAKELNREIKSYLVPNP